MPDQIEYDETRRRLMVGKGFIDNVPAAVWRYEVSGKRVLTQWFSYRKKNRERPMTAGGRPGSARSNPTTGWPSIRPNCSTCCTFWRCWWSWNRPKRNWWRRSVEDRHLITVDELRAAGALDVPAAWRKSLGVERVERDLFSGLSDEDRDPEQQPSPPPEQE